MAISPENTARPYMETLMEACGIDAEFVEYCFSYTHQVAKFRRNDGQLLVIKVHRKSFEAGPTAVDRKFSETELDILRMLGNRYAWAPKLYGCSPEGTWLIKEWVGDFTADQFPREKWTKPILRNFWNFCADIFDFFHRLPSPILLKDIKSQNISMNDEGQFWFFDFDTANDLARTRLKSKTDRTGNGNNRHLAPEILQADLERISVQSEYFSFASLFHLFAVGKLAWSNSVAGLEDSRAKYQEELEELEPNFRKRMEALEFSESEADSVLQCMQPDSRLRPRVFPRPL